MILIVFGFANISFSMALSTAFSDSKFSNQLGGVLLVLPVAIFLYYVSVGSSFDQGIVTDLPSHNYQFIYLFYWIPIVPTCSLLVNLADSPTNCYGYSNPAVFDKCGKHVQLLTKYDVNCGMVKAFVIPDQ